MKTSMLALGVLLVVLSDTSAGFNIPGIGEVSLKSFLPWNSASSEPKVQKSDRKRLDTSAIDQWSRLQEQSTQRSRIARPTPAIVEFAERPSSSRDALSGRRRNLAGQNDSRTLINAPRRNCGSGMRMDNAGRCRSIFR